MEKLVLKAEKDDKKTLPVFIGIDLLDQIKEIKSETNIPIRRIVEKCIRFGLDNLEIEEED
ncbi:hypothetical protein [Enterococcus devriesei]|uniref:hypothetical protein n=1 Tax=Enterococcus devriesei TaxID=319970 RepID=UPI0028A913B2|nr:hypothetical protein [Enterococcus devriesei]